MRSGTCLGAGAGRSDASAVARGRWRSGVRGRIVAGGGVRAAGHGLRVDAEDGARRRECADAGGGLRGDEARGCSEE